MVNNGHVNTTFAMIIKQRGLGGSTGLRLVGEVAGKDCIIVDDMIDTGTTLVRAAQHLIHNGARSVHAFASHGLFSENAPRRIGFSHLSEVIVSNTVPLMGASRRESKIKQVLNNTVLISSSHFPNMFLIITLNRFLYYDFLACVSLQLSLAPLFAEAIKRQYKLQSLVHLKAATHGVTHAINGHVPTRQDREDAA